MDSLHYASGLAIGLAQDPSLSVRRGRWAYNPGDHVLQVGVPDGALLDPRDRGLIGHEIAHRRISFYHLYLRPTGSLPLPILANLLNAVEDPRVNSWFCQIYPGGAAWMQAVYDGDRAVLLPATPSLFLQYASAASIADAWEWQVPEGWRLDPRVIAALSETRAARRRYATEELPISALDRKFAEEDLAQALRHEVEPLLAIDGTPRPPATRAAALALISAARAYKLFQASILPIAARLIERDLSVLAGRTHKDPKFRRALQAALSADGAGLADLVEEGLAGDSEEKPGALEKDAYISMLTRRQGLQPGAGWSPIGDSDSTADETRGPLHRRDKPEPTPGLPEKIAEVLRSQLGPLVHDLQFAFRQPTRSRCLRGFPSGARLDMRAALRFSIDRREHDRLWLRWRRAAPVPEAAVLLLVDLSGSMGGAKIEAAVLGTILLARALQELGSQVRFAVEGFQDERIPFKTFTQPVTPALLDSFKDMVLEVAGTRPGGRNQPRYNDDGPCLREAAALLLAQPCPRRLMFVVSDGVPEGRRSKPDDLRAAVAEVSRHLHIVGLGLGSATAHVKEFYPHAVANIPIGDFAHAIGDVVAKALNEKR